MKVLFVTLFSLLCIASLANAQTLSAANADETAVKKVITDETNAFFTKNREQWVNLWVHEPYVSWSAQGEADKILTQSGWEAYSSMFDGYFNNSSTSPIPSIQRNNFRVNVLDKTATASFLQTRQQTDGRKLISREVRVLEKQDNDWKLVYVNSRNVD